MKMKDNDLGDVGGAISSDKDRTLTAASEKVLNSRFRVWLQ